MRHTSLYGDKGRKVQEAGFRGIRAMWRIGEK